MNARVSISANGQMSLPADIRKRLGLTKGGTLFVEETPNGLILRTPAQAIAEAQAIARHYTGDNPNASVDAFLEFRRLDSGE